MLVLLILLCCLRGGWVKQVPTTFGLTTVTHSRGGDNSQFMTYLQRYAEMKCPIVTEINIVWNNEQSMEEMGIFARKQYWKRPVYFYRTPFNSMDWRYKIANQSKAEVYFCIDDDIQIDCQELMRGFGEWQKRAMGNVGPILTYAVRYSTFVPGSGFVYGDPNPRNEKYFSIALIGLSFLSRHFMQLYYADVWQINEMREIILKKNNCDDIALNFIIGYYYPEMAPVGLSGNVKNISPRVSQANMPTHYVYRKECCQEFTNILGINPLRFIPIADTLEGREARKGILSEQIVALKVDYINRNILKH